MLKRLLPILMVTAVIGFAAAAHARTYTIAHVLAGTHPFTLAMQQFADEVKEKTNGKIAFDVLHSGVLGGEVEMVPQVMSGTLDCAIIGGITTLQSFSPKAAIEDLPFIYKDSQHAYRAVDGELGRMVAEQVIEPLGLHVLGYLDCGWRHMTNNKRPLNKPEDLKGIKFRCPPSPMRVKMFEAFGASAVPIAFPELFTALQQGTVDGQENPLAIIATSKLNEVQKYLSLTGHVYTSGPVMMNKNLWNSFSEEEKGIINAAMRRAITYERELMNTLSEDLIGELKAQGMQINEVDKDAFAKLARPIWDGYIKQNGSEMVDAIARAAQ